MPVNEIQRPLLDIVSHGRRGATRSEIDASRL